MAELMDAAQLDLSGGENVVSNPYLLGQKQSQQVSNFILDEHGSLRTRDGTLVQGAASPLASKPITNIYDFVKVDGTVKQTAIVYQSGSANTLYDRSTNPWTAIGNFTTAEATPQSVTFTNLMLIANGYETVRQWDGATFAASGGGVSAKHLAPHLGYLWVWNTAAATTATDGPSSLRSSAVNDTTSMPGANQTFVSKDDGQSGQGIGLFTIAETGISPTATLIAFKDYSSYEVSGVFGATNFSVQKLKTDMGCVAPRTIQFVSGFGIIRLTHKGFALFDGVNDTLISEEIRPRLFGRDSFTAIRWVNANLSYAVQVQNPPLYVCVCPTQDTSLNRWFIYDLVRKSWTVGSFANTVSCLQLITDPNAQPVVLGGDFVNQRVRRYFAGDTDDDGTAISWSWVTKPIFHKSPMSRCLFRRAIVKMFAFTTGSSVTASFNVGPTALVTSKAVNIPSALSPFGGFGIDAWGTTGFGSVPNANQTTDVDVNFDIGMKGNTCYLTLSGTGPMRIRGIDWHYRPMPLTRSTIAA